jgi:hypothetical protein
MKPEDFKAKYLNLTAGNKEDFRLDLELVVARAFASGRREALLEAERMFNVVDQPKARSRVSSLVRWDGTSEFKREPPAMPPFPAPTYDPSAPKFDLGPFPTIHPREFIVDQTERAVLEATKDLTPAEVLRIFADRVARIAKYAIRQERHGDTDTPGGITRD